MAHVQRTDVVLTAEEWLNKHFLGQVVLWVYDHISEPNFITSFMLWAVKAAARVLEPLLLVCAVYLMVSMGIPSLMRQDLHDFSMSVLTGAPDVILPGGFATVLQKIAKKNYISAGILSILLVAMAILTGIANADIFKVIQMVNEDINKLLFWRSMIGLTYSTTIIITLLTGRHAEESVRLVELQQEADTLRDQLEAEQKQTSDLHQQIEAQVQRATLLQKQLGNAQQEIDRLRQDLSNEQQQNATLTEELTTGQGDTTTIRKQLSTALAEVDALKGSLEDKGRSLDQLQQRLTAEQKRSATLSNELDTGQGDTTSLRKQLGVALSDAELLRSQLKSKGIEVDSLNQLLAGNSEHLRQQLETEQEASVTLRKDLQSAKLQVVDLTSELAEATRHVEKLQDAERQVSGLTVKLEGKDKELVVISSHLQSAKLSITKLQQVEKQVESLTTQLQEKEQECERTKSQISQLTVKLRESKSVKESTLSQGNITSIDQARVKVKASDNEIIAYMKEHPSMKVPEVASHFEVTPRTIYNVLKRQDTGDETCETEAVGES